MLELQRLHQMPHAVSTDHLPLPSITAWPYGKQDSSSILQHFQNSRQAPAWTKSSSVGPPTPPEDMSNQAALGAPIFRGNQVNTAFLDYPTMSNSYLPPISRLEEPQSQRRFSNTNAYEAQSAMSSPQGSTTTSPSMNVPDTVRTPQQDIAELAAEVSFRLNFC
jgi:hypothetical protein